MSYAEPSVPYTRIHEYRHLHPERDYTKAATVTFKEFSRTAGIDDDPYYPVKPPEDRDRFALYQAQAAKDPNTIFGGRLGAYAYLDMDTTILAALDLYGHDIKGRV